MADIDWDSVAFEADHSPRALLAELLADADEIETLVVIISKADKEDPKSKQVRWETSGDGVSSLGLAQYCLNGLTKYVAGE